MQLLGMECGLPLQSKSWLWTFFWILLSFLVGCFLCLVSLEKFSHKRKACFCQNSKSQPKIMVMVKVSLRKIQENNIPKNASSDKNIAAMEVGVYFWQRFCNKKAINVLKIPRYRIESKVLLFSSCLKGIDPSKKGAKSQERIAATASCSTVKRMASSAALYRAIKIICKAKCY